MLLAGASTAFLGRGAAPLGLERPAVRRAASASMMAVDPHAWKRTEGSKLWTPSDILWTPPEKGGLREAQYGSLGKYCEDLAAVKRSKTRTVTAGPVKFGSEHQIVRQTMATTTTRDVKKTIDQVTLPTARVCADRMPACPRPACHTLCE